MKKLCTIFIIIYSINLFNFYCLPNDNTKQLNKNLKKNNYFFYKDVLKSSKTYKENQYKENDLVVKGDFYFIDINAIKNHFDEEFPKWYYSNLSSVFENPDKMLLWTTSINDYSKIILLFNKNMNDFQTLFLPKGQGPFEINSIGNVFYLKNNYLGVISFNKLIFYQLNENGFKPVYSGKIKDFTSTRNKKIILSFAKSFLIFADNIKQKKADLVTWYYIYQMKNGKPVLHKKVDKNSAFLIKFMGIGSNLKKNDPMDIIKEMTQKERIIVFPGFNNNEFYFFNPITGIIACIDVQSGNLLTHSCWNTKYTDYKVKIKNSFFKTNKQSFTNNQGIVAAIGKDLFLGNLWVLRKINFSKKNKKIALQRSGIVDLSNCPTWDIFDKNLNYKKTIRLYIQPEKYERFYIKNFVVTGENYLTVIAYVKEWEKQGEFKCLNIFIRGRA